MAGWRRTRRCRCTTVTGSARPLTVAVWAGGWNVDIPNTNQPTLDALLTTPTRTRPAAAATGLFASSRAGIQALIWRLGSMGREGVNLSGNNQPDFQEPYFG